MKQSSKIYEDHKHALNKFKINQIILIKLDGSLTMVERPGKGNPIGCLKVHGRELVRTWQRVESDTSANFWTF